MKLTFLRSPSDIKAISLSKDSTRLYIKMELLEYLNLNIKENGQLSLASTDKGEYVLVDNSYYNNFRYTIPKTGNPFVQVKGVFNSLNVENQEIKYDMERISIGDKEDIPAIVFSFEESEEIEASSSDEGGL